MTQDKLDGMMKWIHWNNLIKTHIFENRIYAKIRKCGVSNGFLLTSAAMESLGDIAVQQLRKNSNLQGVAVSLEIIMIKMLAEKKESLLFLYFISRRCTEVWCPVIFMLSNHLWCKIQFGKKSVITMKNYCNILINLSALIILFHFFFKGSL